MADTSAVSSARAIVQNRHTFLNTVEVDPEQADGIVDTLVSAISDLLRDYDQVFEELRQLKPTV